MSKKVTFSSEAYDDSSSCQATLEGFKTWPNGSIKLHTSADNVPKRKRKAAAFSKDPEVLINDLYHHFTGLNSVDTATCLEHIISRKCTDKLKLYTILNMILKDTEETNTKHNVELNSDFINTVFKMVVSDFDYAVKSGEVRDTWTLQQIMRSVEQVWIRSEKEERALAVECFVEITHRCIDLIESKGGSKTLLSPAVRLANIATEQKLITPPMIVRLLNALSRTQFLFASSFITEAMLILSTIHRTCIDALNECEAAWVPLAIRALGSSSSLTRNLALQLIQYHSATLPTPESPGLLAACLMQPSEPRRSTCEPLYRVMVRKMASISAVSSDDAKIMVQAWVAVLQSAFYTEKDWPLLDVWLDIVRVAFSKWPSTISIAWSAILSAQSVHQSYSRALVAPLVASQYGDETQSEIAKMIVDAVKSAANGLCETKKLTRSDQRIVSSEIWAVVMEPVFKSMVNAKSIAILSSWAQILEQGLIATVDVDVPKYLEILSLAIKAIARQENQSPNQLQQQFDDFGVIWLNCINSGASSRQRVMELVKFHYSSLSQLSGVSSLALMLTNRLIAHLPPTLLTEKPKNSTFEYLTLILLPVVTFMDGNGDYIDRVLSSCKSEKTMRIMLYALLATVETGSDTENNNKLSKWMMVANTIKNNVSAHDGHESNRLVTETMTTFIPLMTKASEQQWLLWVSLLDEHKESHSKVLSQVKKLPAQGLQHLLATSKSLSKEDKTNLIKRSFSVDVLAVLKNQAEEHTLDTEILDSVARYLVSQGKPESFRWATELLSPNRRFVIAKPLLQVIENTANDDLIQLWNKQIEPHIHNCPPFISSAQASRLNIEISTLKIEPELIIKSSSTKKRMLETPSPGTRAKRPRRQILTGSIQPSLFTPPNSDLADSTLHDDISSSPPSQKSPESMPQSWKNSVERARTLKRLMLGFDMEEAVQSMKRSEKQMIYNLLFKSCVSLKTHLAETGPMHAEGDVKAAQEELIKTVELHKSLQMQEEIMIENGKRRAQESIAQDESSSSEDDIPSDELDIEEFDLLNEVKAEIL